MRAKIGDIVGGLVVERESGMSKTKGPLYVLRCPKCGGAVQRYAVFLSRLGVSGCPHCARESRRIQMNKARAQAAGIAPGNWFVGAFIKAVDYQSARALCLDGGREIWLQIKSLLLRREKEKKRGANVPAR